MSQPSRPHRLQKDTVPTNQRAFALDVVRRLREAGFEALWAGGCVRDLLLGRDASDYDVATNATPDAVRKLFGRRRTLAVGAAFGVIVVLPPRPPQTKQSRAKGSTQSRQHTASADAATAADTVPPPDTAQSPDTAVARGSKNLPPASQQADQPESEQHEPSDARRTLQPIEVATFREEEGYSDGRRPDRVVFSTAEQDALRRDFTINGIFYDPLRKQVVDYVGGQEDLRQGIVRAIGNPEQRIAEDKLRMLRAARFAGTLAFRLDPDTAAAVRRHAAEILQVSPERIADELRKMLKHPGRARCLELCRRLDLLTVILPELQPLFDATESAWPTTLHRLDVLDRAAATVHSAVTVADETPPIAGSKPGVESPPAENPPYPQPANALSEPEPNDSSPPAANVPLERPVERRVEVSSHTPPVTFPLAWAALFVDLRKTVNVSAIGRRLRLSNDETRRATWLLEHLDDLNALAEMAAVSGPPQVPPEQPPATNSEPRPQKTPTAQAATPRRFELADAKRLLANENITDLLTLARADALAHSEPPRGAEAAERLLRLYSPSELDPPPLLTGKDLIELGYRPGRLFAEVLEVVRRAQLNEQLADRAAAIQLAQQAAAAFKNRSQRK